jgi:hypothetical protein
MPMPADAHSELDAKGFNRSIETMIPHFAVEEIDINTSVGVMTGTLRLCTPLLILKLPGRPLKIVPITTTLVYGQRKGGA